jgi:hypothetical protein
MGLLYEIGKVNSELNNGVLGTLVSDTYGNYHGDPHPSFSYSNDLHPDSFGINVSPAPSQGQEQHFLFIVKEVRDTLYGKEIVARFWDGWQGKCWGVVELGDDSYIEIITNFTATDTDVKFFKGFNIQEASPFNNYSSIQFAYFNGSLYLFLNENTGGTIKTKFSKDYGNIQKFRFAIRIIPDLTYGIKKINVALMNFNDGWLDFPPVQERLFFGDGTNSLGLKLFKTVKLYDFYFI